MNDDGRAASIDRAYRDHATDVYRVAYAILHDPDAAADATQEAFAKAYERWDAYDTTRPLRPWLHAIVARLALDALRRHRIRHVPIAGEATPGRTAEDVSDAADRRDLVRRGLERLPPQVRGAVVLRHFYGYDYAEIARFLGTSSGNVGSMLSRANAALRHELADVDGDAGREVAESRARPAAHTAAAPERAGAPANRGRR